MRGAVPAVLCCTVFSSAAGAPPAHVPYGHRDFYPSPERPIGFQADGTGNYPGATPVTEWWEGALKVVEKEVGEGEERRKVKVRVRTAGDSKNIVWKTRVPGWSDTQPLVIGDRIVGIAEPDWIFCIDAGTGKMLWQDRVMPLFLGPPMTNDTPSVCEFTPEEAWKRQQVVDITRAATIAARALQTVIARGEDAAYNAKAIARLYELREVIGRLDPSPDIMAGMDALIRAWQDCAATRSASKATKSPMYPGHSGNVNYLLGPVMARYRLAIYQVWPNFVGLVQSTPVTDGERVYVAYGPGQVAAYDLTGKRVWGWREMKFQLGGVLYCDHTPSLILADGVLLVRSHYGDLMGIDPRTGKILHNTDIGDSYNHGAFSTPGVMRLTSPGGKKLTVIITQHDKVIAAADGRIVAKLPHFFHEIGHGQPRMVWKDMALLESSAGVPPDKGPAIIVKLALADDGTVSVAKLHNFGGSRFPNPPMALTADGHLLGAGALWRLLDGAKIPGMTGPADGSVAIAGTYAFNPRDDRNPTTDSWLSVTFACWSLPAVGESKVLPGRRELGFEEIPGECDLDTWMPGFDAAHRSSLPYFFGLRNGSLVPSGNRLYAQSASFMYCIGDPKVPYDWNPESRPAAIRKALAAHAAAKAKAGPVQGLASHLAWDRDRAVAAIGAMPAGKKTVLTADIVKILHAGEWPGFDTALRVLREMGPQAASGVPDMLRVARKALADKRADRVASVVETVRAIAPGKQAELVAALAAALKSKDPESLRAAGDSAAVLGRLAKSTVPLLTRLVAHADDRVSAAAGRALAGMGKSAAPAVPALATRLRSTNPVLLVALLDALRAAGVEAKPAVADIAPHVASRNPDVSIRASRTLEAMGSAGESAFPHLVRGFRHSARNAAVAAVAAALAVEPSKQMAVAEVLTEMLGDANERVAQNGAVALGRFGPGLNEYPKLVAVDGLSGAMKGKSTGTKYRIIAALVEFGAAAESAIPVLRDEANASDCPAAAKEALSRIKPGTDASPESDIDLDDLF